MDCVYTAYAQALRSLGIEATARDYQMYRFLKVLTHGTTACYTWAGVVPWMLQVLSHRRGIDQTTEYWGATPAHYLADADDVVKRWIVRRFSDGNVVDRLTLEPAIYLCNRIQHAVFAAEIPHKLVPMMAIQLRRKEEPCLVLLTHEYHPECTLSRGTTM